MIHEGQLFSATHQSNVHPFTNLTRLLLPNIKIFEELDGTKQFFLALNLKDCIVYFHLEIIYSVLSQTNHEDYITSIYKENRGSICLTF